MELLEECHIIQATGHHRFTFIFLHGRGSSGPAFAEELSQGRNSDGKTLFEAFEPLGCKWIFPSAPKRWSYALREQTRDWFDIYSLARPESNCSWQISGLSHALPWIHKIIAEELNHVPASRIALGGISQGYATAIHALLSGDRRLGAFIGLCGWLPFQSRLQMNLEDRRVKLEAFYNGLFEERTGMGLESFSASLGPLQTPTYLSHSKDDSTVRFDLGMGACRTLRALGMKADFFIYEAGGHWLKEPEDYDNITSFLRRLAA